MMTRTVHAKFECHDANDKRNNNNGNGTITFVPSIVLVVMTEREQGVRATAKDTYCNILHDLFESQT
jgi:hypothetical protein